jgi:hypothetical protein
LLPFIPTAGKNISSLTFYTAQDSSIVGVGTLFDDGTSATYGKDSSAPGVTALYPSVNTTGEVLSMTAYVRKEAAKQVQVPAVQGPGSRRRLFQVVQMVSGGTGLVGLQISMQRGGAGGPVDNFSWGVLDSLDPTNPEEVITVAGLKRADLTEKSVGVGNGVLLAVTGLVNSDGESNSHVFCCSCLHASLDYATAKAGSTQRAERTVQHMLLCSRGALVLLLTALPHLIRHTCSI